MTMNNSRDPACTVPHVLRRPVTEQLRRPDTRPDDMITMRQAYESGAACLAGAGIEEARTDAWMLFEAAFGISRTAYLACMDDPAPVPETERFERMIQRRMKHVPAAYLTGRAYFYGYEFAVDERVLIPRQDTETLVEEALLFLKEYPDREPTVLDLCCGSGCILLTILKEMPNACGVGTDLSPGALQVASENCRRLGLHGLPEQADPDEKQDAGGGRTRCRITQADLFDGDWFHCHPGTRFSLITCNPPYIPSDVIPGLMEEVRLHEPHMALDGWEDGLLFYRRLTRQAPAWLKDGGMLLCEIGYDQGEAVRTLFLGGGFEEVRVIKDLAGRDRVVMGIRRKRYCE